MIQRVALFVASLAAVGVLVVGLTLAGFASRRHRRDRRRVAGVGDRRCRSEPTGPGRHGLRRGTAETAGDRRRPRTVPPQRRRA